MFLWYIDRWSFFTKLIKEESCFYHKWGQAYTCTYPKWFRKIFYLLRCTCTWIYLYSPIWLYYVWYDMYLVLKVVDPITVGGRILVTGDKGLDIDPAFVQLIFFTIDEKGNLTPESETYVPVMFKINCCSKNIENMKTYALISSWIKKKSTLEVKS